MMKKLIRFIIALIFSPLLLALLFLDWVYETDNFDKEVDNWLKRLTFQDIIS